jgi:hypothetical protein
MGEPATLQGILGRYLGDYRARHALDGRRLAVCGHLLACRTPALGGWQLACDHCADEAAHYFSCRDRHCPRCQGRAGAAWSARRQRDLLPVTYFHLVFTLPDGVNAWARLHPEVVYGLLFKAVWETMKAFGADRKRLGGELGMTAVLHTWGQTLTRHVHLHCLVPGGALSAAGAWHAAKSTYLFPVKALSRRLRGVMVSALRAAFEGGELPRVSAPGEPARTLDALMARDWVVYSRPGLHEPAQVLDYLARYTRHTAITDARLVSMDDGQVRFRYKDYRDRDRVKVMTLAAGEFIARFLQHVLPKGLMRVRHYGFLANACRARKLARVREALAQPVEACAPQETETRPFDGYPCPKCRQGRLHPTALLAPVHWAGDG